MADDLAYLVADPDYYQPWDTADQGRPYYAGPMPPGWTRQDSGAWTHWDPDGLVLPDTGWKVHVSSSMDHAQSVLMVVSAACAELGVSFKHLAGHRTFLLMHGKHAHRVQAGKFCALYPPTEQCALLLLRRLEAELSGIEGPLVLTDRRFGASMCVSYRYGGFRSRTRVDADGNRMHSMLGADGEEIDDQRLPKFHLPPGVSDPFRQEAAETAPALPTPKRPVTLHGYTFEAVIQQSNAGGAYRFRSALGELVFFKEAKAHNGYTEDGDDAKTRLNAEYLTLRAIHIREPGLCPRPMESFRHWEHSYLVTELVPGISLYRWMLANNPALRIAPTAEEFAEYYRRSLALLDQLHAQLRRLHEIGFVFVDLSPNNVLVEDDQVRLIDFEAVQPIEAMRRFMGTPGYMHPDPESAAKGDPRELDRYGLAALALLLLFPLHEVVQRHPRALDHVRADLAELAPVEPRLWQWATQYHDRVEDSALPTPQTVREDTVAALRWLADRTADSLEAMAQPDHPARVYPTIPLGYRTDTRAVAAGTAGVLYALHRAGRECDRRVVRRLRDEAVAAASTSAPGLLFGSAGIACVLGELGETEAAETLLTAAVKHPLSGTSASLGGGAAGTALGLLIQHRRTGEQRWLEAAERLLLDIPDGAALETQLSPIRRSGLVGGRAGVALALYHLYRLTGENRLFDRGMRLLGEELAYAERVPGDGLQFKASHTDPRIYPYLFAGSAGQVSVLSRYLAHRPDAEFEDGSTLRAAEMLEYCLRACSIRFTALPGLLPGLAGLASVLAGAGRRLGRPELVDAAFTSARGLFRHAIPQDDGVVWLGEPGVRLSAELWSGSAGILLALHDLVDPAPSPLDLLDVHLPAPRNTDRPLWEGRRDQHGRSPAVAG